MFSFLVKRKIAILLGLTLGVAGMARAQTPPPCDAVARQVLIDLVTQTDLPAIATQYGLEQTPLDQAGTPPTYLMKLRDDNPQTACQVVEAMYTDARIL